MKQSSRLTTYLLAACSYTAYSPACAASSSLGMKTSVEINDISNLNLTQVNRIVSPTTVAELVHLVEAAKKDGLKVCMAGKRHSQGGHTFYPNAVVVDTNKLNKIICLDREKKVITVQPGVTWKQIQQYCNPYNLALKVTQTANIFTVGGSLSVNCHGRDPHYGPLIETIQSFRILLANGSLVNASRQENQELFSLAIGGYGLFGIITEVDIALTHNTVYRKKSKVVSVAHYADFVRRKIINNEQVGLHYGQIALNDEKIITTTYTATDRYNKKAFHLHKERRVLVGKSSLALQRRYCSLNTCRSIFESIAKIRESIPQTTCRNNAMQHPVECLEHVSEHDTDLLQSYFIPLDGLPEFVRTLKKYVHSRKIRLLNVLIRYIPKDTESFLRYATRDRFEIVIFFNINRSAADVTYAQTWTQKLIDKVLALDGCYYLPTQLWATDAQIRRAYPMLDAFFAKKREYDPEELFINGFYKRYCI